MSLSLNEIITDAEVLSVHANANFGTMPMRRVIANGVIKCALGWDVGSTQFHILREHKLITKSKSLTKKGKHYARVLFMNDQFHLE